MAVPSAGDFNQRVTLTAPTYAKGAMGGAVRAEGPGVDLWAKVEPISANERFADGALQTRPELRVMIRWRAGIRLRDGLRWRGQDYEISAEPRESDARQGRRYLELLCIKRQPGAGTLTP